MLRASSTDRVFILAGAGVSAESGIPTFRGVGGLWRNYRVEEVASPEAWNRDPQLVWEFYSMRRRVASPAKPNPAHFALAKLENAPQDRLFVCTQNVDNLHEQAGSSNVVHMQGERMLFGESRRGIARLVRFLVTGGKALLQLRVLRFRRDEDGLRMVVASNVGTK